LLQSILNARNNGPAQASKNQQRKIENAEHSSEENFTVESHVVQPPRGAQAPSSSPPNIPAPGDHPRKRPRSMQSKSFYSGVSLRLEHVEERVLRFLAVLRDRVLSKRAAVPWRQFPTQQAAFDFADANDPGGETLRTFSVELSSSGKRKFLVTSYTELWRRYSAMVPHHRHYYEIIREGSPCHLYLGERKPRMDIQRKRVIRLWNSTRVQFV